MIPAIRDEITASGPLPVARAMALAANHYYAVHEPFGAQGDFVTSPEISQIFGELIGLCLADMWVRAGQPSPFLLVELGPGRGTLMSDALRACRHVLPPFAESAQLHIVEQSPRLRAIQARAFPSATFHDDIRTLPDNLPILLVTNEFLDALPLTQFERTEDGWALRRIGPDGWDLDLAANLQFIPDSIRDAVPGSVYERNFAAESLVSQIGARLKAQSGAALFIDYGYIGPAIGDTLQSIRHGRFADVIQTLGEADISAHVDFGAMARAGGVHANVHGPIDQGTFLFALGIRERADRLKAAASLQARAEIEAAVARLTGAGAMGLLFQVLALTSAGWPQPSGFPTKAE